MNLLELTPILISLGFLSLLLLWIAITNRKNPKLLMVIIPVTILANLTVFFTFDRLLGYPVVGKIPDGSLYIHHVGSMDKEWMHVWVYEKNDDNNISPRAYSIPNTKNNRKQMEQARKKGEQGVPQQVQEQQVKGSNVDTEKTEYEMYDFDPVQAMSKNGTE